MRQFFKPYLFAALFGAAALQAQQWNGLTLYSNQNTTTGYLLDTNSTVVKTFTFTGQTGYSTHMMPGGTIWRTIRNQSNSLNGGGMTGRIQKTDYNGTVLWDYTYSSSTYCLHHDHCPLPNGNVLVISYDVKTSAEAATAGATNPIAMWSEKIMELKPVGTNSAIVVWEWHVWDHLVQNTNPSGANYKSSIVDNPQLLNINYSTQKDWMHMNGVDYNPILDQIVCSSHNLNEWYVIDHSTTTAEAASHSGGNAGKGGDFLYRWGNPLAYSASGTKILNVTHDAHWIPEGVPTAGYLVGVNNGGASGPKTTIDQIDPPRTDYNYTITPGSAYEPASYLNRHTSTGYTSNMGSSQQFPNGNQLVCLATAGLIYEVDAAGTTLWTKSTSGVTPNSVRYDQCYIDNPAPAQPTITANSGTLSTASAASYQWYVNGNLISGATAQTYVPSQSGIYVVRTTDTNGCVYAYSAGTSFTLTNDPGGPYTGIASYGATSGISVYPNPTKGVLTVNAKNIAVSDLVLNVYDSTGKLLMSEHGSNQLDLSGLSVGMYLLSISSSGTAPVMKKISVLTNK